MIWNSIPTADQTPANVVLGQPDTTSGAANNGGLSATSMDCPEGVFSDGTRLYVADGSNNRVLIWNSVPTANEVPANVVLGVANMTSTATVNNWQPPWD